MVTPEEIEIKIEEHRQLFPDSRIRWNPDTAQNMMALHGADTLVDLAEGYESEMEIERLVMRCGIPFEAARSLIDGSSH